MTGGAVVVAQTTTLAHIAALPIMVAPEDLVLVDAQTHDSVHLATQALKGGGVRVESVPHSDMSALDRRLAELGGDFRHIWYLADGVYSMHGDLAPVKEVAALQGRYENLYTYYDDAHGFGWQGETGRGYVLSETPINDRMVVSAGLSKSFASLGAVLVFGDAEMAQRVRMVGGPLTFSGPVPPPDLGAAVESARIHLSPEYPERQARLLADIEWVRSEIVRRNLPVASLATSPIWFVRVGPSKPSVELTRRLMKDGFYLNASIFPAVPIGAGGVRFAQTLHNTREQLSGLLDAIERRLPEFAPSTEVIVDLRDDAEVLVDGTDISRM
jgi:7-keto-8-aminopelargonate synthetase-like enzyme